MPTPTSWYPRAAAILLQERAAMTTSDPQTPRTAACPLPAEECGIPGHPYHAEAATGAKPDLRFEKALTEYGVHHYNCPFESWNKGATRCKCGLFALIKEANARLAASKEERP